MILLGFPIRLVEFSVLTVKGGAPSYFAPSPIRWGQNPPPIAFVVPVCQEIPRFIDPAQFPNRAA